MKRAILLGMLAAVFFAAGQAHAQTVSAVQARETALAMTGGGAISSLELTVDPVMGPVFQIAILNNNVRYDVLIDAGTGGVLRLSAAGDVPPAAAAAPGFQQQDGIVVGTVVPRLPRRPGGPSNPPVSAQMAVEIARDHLLSIGVSHARFDYVYMDRERGRWVWSVEFDGRGGRDYEFYIDVNTGAIIKFEMGS